MVEPVEPTEEELEQLAYDEEDSLNDEELLDLVPVKLHQPEEQEEESYEDDEEYYEDEDA